MILKEEIYINTVVLSKVLQLLKLPDGTVKVLVEGEKRVKIIKHEEKNDNYLNCEVESC